MMMTRRRSRRQIWVQNGWYHTKSIITSPFEVQIDHDHYWRSPVGQSAVLPNEEFFFKRWRVNKMSIRIYNWISLWSDPSKAQWDSTSHLSQDLGNSCFAGWWKKRDEFAKVVAQKRIRLKQDPVSTMQKNVLANYSPFMFCSVLKKGITNGRNHY